MRIQSLGALRLRDATIVIGDEALKCWHTNFDDVIADLNVNAEQCIGWTLEERQQWARVVKGKMLGGHNESGLA